MRTTLGTIRSLVIEASKKVVDLSTKKPRGIGYDERHRTWPGYDKAWKQQVDDDGAWNSFALGNDLVAFTYDQEGAYTYHGGTWKKFDVKRAHELYTIAVGEPKDPTYGLGYYDIDEKDKTRLTFKQVEARYPDAIPAAVENESMVRVGEDKMSPDDAIARRVVQKTWKFWTHGGTLYVDFPEGDTIGVWDPKGKAWEV